jgi:DNA primase
MIEDLNALALEICQKNIGLVAQYLEARGVEEATMRKFSLGYCVEGSLVSAALARGFKGKDLERTGFVRQEVGREFFSGRLVFPIRDLEGLAGFGGRLISGFGSKYINSPETERFIKSRLLYGLFEGQEGIRSSRSVMLVEGYVDVLMLHQFGRNNALGLMGTSLTRDQCESLVQLGVTKVELCFDGNAAGFRATAAALQRLVAYPFEVMVWELQDGDPAEHLRTHGFLQGRILAQLEAAQAFLTPKDLFLYCRNVLEKGCNEVAQVFQAQVLHQLNAGG